MWCSELHDIICRTKQHYEHNCCFFLKEIAGNLHLQKKTTIKHLTFKGTVIPSVYLPCFHGVNCQPVKTKLEHAV